MRRFQRLAFFFCLASLGFETRAEVAQTSVSGDHVRTWTSENGLPQNWVKSLAQTPDGALWVGTGTALVRFDGLDFEIFDRTNTPVLPSLEIDRLMVDSQGKLWISTQAGLVSWKEGIFSPERLSDGGRLPSGLKLVEDHGGGFWAVVGRGQIYRRTGGSWRLAGAADSAPQSGRLLNGSRPVGPGQTPLASERLLPFAIHGERTLVRMEGGQLLPLETAQGPASGRAPFLFQGRILWAAGTKALLRYEVGSGSLRLEPLPPIEAPSRPTALLETRDGVIWAGLDDGLYRLDGEQLVREWATAQIRSLFEDREGSLWAGTLGAGLIQIRRQTKFEMLTSREGLPSEVVWTALEDRQGAVWIGTDQGLARWDGQRIEKVETGLELDHRPIFSLAEDSEGVLWAGGSAGVASFDGRQWRPVEFGLSRPNVRGEIFVEPGGITWVGVQSHMVHRLAGSGEQFSKLGTGPRGLHRDRRGRLWLATTGRGVLRYEEGEFLPVGPEERMTSAYDFLEEEDGTLWVSTRDQGLFRFRDDEVAAVGRRHGLADGTIHRVLDDGLGWYWMASDRGVLRVRREDLHAAADGRIPHFESTAYGLEDGLLTVECNSGFPGATRLRDGRLAFATMKGLALVDPARLPKNEVAPSVEIAQVLVDYDPVQVAENWALEPEQRNLAIEYRAMTFVAPEAATFRYRLEGYDQDWVEAGTRRSAHYTNLPPGKYAFHLQAANADGVWSEEKTLLEFERLPRFQETTGFYVFLFLGTVFLVWSAARWRHSHLHEQVLERLVAERTHSLNERTRSLEFEKRRTEAQAAVLEAQAARLQEMHHQRNRFFTDVSHELKTPLALLVGPLEERAEDSENPRRHEDKRMARNARRLSRRVDEILDLARLEAGAMPLRCQEGDLVAFCRECLGAFESMAERRDLRLELQSPEESVPWIFDPDRLEKILFNLVSNALKFTPPGGRVQLVVSAREGGARLSVEDSGVGLTEEERSRIFDRFQCLGPDQGGEISGTGLGLSVVKDLVEQQGGRIRVESGVGEGTRFVVDLPLPAAPEEAHPEGESALEPASSELPPLQSVPTVLVVEDDGEMRAYLESLLGRRFQVLLAEDGRQGLERVREHRPDLVLTDVSMPDLDGFGLAQALASDPETETIPVVALSAHGSLDRRVEGLASGIDGFLAQPFSPKELLACIDQQIEGRLRLKHRFAQRIQLEGTPVEVASTEDELLRRILGAVEEHLHDARFGVLELAESVGLSPRHLRRRLLDLTEESPSHLIRRLRLERARQLLEQGAGNVSQVAMAVGIPRPAQFSEAFRKAHGAPPSRFLRAS